MRTLISRYIKIVLLLVGGIITTNGLYLALTTNMNVGVILTILLGLGLFSYGIFYTRVNDKFFKWLKIALILLLAILLGFVSFLFIYGNADNVSHEEGVIIVLGASVHGETPGEALQDRLDAAVDYHQENPRAMIIVSGGKGLQEKITEALAMERYLISQGISSDHIIKEEKATSTYENFLYSKEILEKQLGIDAENHTVAFVTSEYHVFRAASVAEATGFEHVTHIHSTTRWYSALPSVLRECLAIVKFWLLRN